MARALLRRAAVLVMDEATANVGEMSLEKGGGDERTAGGLWGAAGVLEEATAQLETGGEVRERKGVGGVRRRSRGGRGNAIARAVGRDFFVYAWP